MENLADLNKREVFKEGDELLRSIATCMNKMTRKGVNPNTLFDLSSLNEAQPQTEVRGSDLQVNSRLSNKTNVETLFGVKFTSLSDVDDFSMSIKEGKYADVLSTMSSADIDDAVNVIETIRKKFQDEVNKAGGTQLSSSPKVSTSSPLVSPYTTINVPHKLNSIDVAATFRVPLTTVGDLHKLINDIEAGKHKELLTGMTNDDRMETLDALAGASTMTQPQINSNFRPLVVDPVFNGVNISIPRKVVEKVGARLEHTLYGYFIGKRLTFPVVEYYARNNWGDDFTKETIRVEYEWRPSRCDECKIFSHIHDYCPKKMVNPPIVTTYNVVAPTVEKSNDGFQTVGKKKKRKGKSKSTNSGLFTGPSVKQTVRYETKPTTIAPKKGSTNVSNPSKSSSMLKTADTSLKNDNFTMISTNILEIT
ncbi:hypothetical protein Tco_0564111 [Tanacetum coccineum]